MAELKTKPTRMSVTQFLDSILNIMKSATKAPPKMRSSPI